MKCQNRFSNPKRYDEHPCHFYMGDPPGPFLSMISKCALFCAWTSGHFLRGIPSKFPSCLKSGDRGKSFYFEALYLLINLYTKLCHALPTMPL